MASAVYLVRRAIWSSPLKRRDARSLLRDGSPTRRYAAESTPEVTSPARLAWTGGPAGVPRPPDRRPRDRRARLVHVHELPARARRPVPFPADLPEVLVGRLGLLGDRGPLPAPVPRGSTRCADGRDVVLATGTASGKSLVYQLAFAARRAHAPEGHGAVPVPDEGARARPAPRGPCAEAAAAQGGRLRRRHAAGRTPADPHEREPRADQPRHAPRVAAARPRAVGRLLPAALARGGRRGARAAAASSARTSRWSCAGSGG